MKKILTILLFLPLFALSQDYTQYLPKVAWSTYFDNVVFINTDTFTVDVLPLDLSEPGAFPLVNGKYIVDNRGLRYEVVDTTSYPTLTVVDIFQEGFAPFSGKIGYAYVGPEGSPSLTSYGFEKLDPKAFSYAYAIDMNIIWDAASDTLEYLKPIRATTSIDVNDSILVTLDYLDFEQDTLNTRIDSLTNTRVNKATNIEASTGLNNSKYLTPEAVS